MMAVNWDGILVVKNDTDSENSETETDSEDTDNDTDSEEVQTHDQEKDTRTTRNDKQKRLGKRMAYVLRYGAEVEGLEVLSGGYVSLTELLNTKLMRHDNKEDILKEVEESYNRQGFKRFEMKMENGNIYVRARYRRMEHNPHHKGTQVKRLLETTINYIADHIKYFDLQDFPEEFLVNGIMQRLKRSNRLNNAAFESLLGGNIERLDLSDAVLTEKTLKLVGQRCPHLKQLSLRHCGYIITDHVMEMLLKKLTDLESLDLSGCTHLSDRTINAVVKWCPHIVKLNITGIPNITQQALLHFVTACDRLRRLDISQDQKLSDEGMEVLTQLTRAHKISLTIYGKSLDSV